MEDYLQILFDAIKKATPFTRVEGDVLPLPPDSLPLKSGLLVNCVCEPNYTQGLPEDLLQRCREDAAEALEIASQSAERLECDFDIIGVAIYELVGSDRNIRVYFVNVKKEQLLSFDRARFLDFAELEGSHLDSINELLAENSD